MARYLNLLSKYGDLLEIYLNHKTPLIYVALTAIKQELFRLYEKLEGEVGTEKKDAPPPPDDPPPPKP